MQADNVDFYEVTDGPTGGALVTLQEFKDFAKIETDAENSFLQVMIDTAIEDLELWTNRWFLSRTAEGNFTRAKVSRYEAYPYVEVQKAPLLSVSQVEVYDGTSFAAYTDYKLKRKEGYSRIWLTQPFAFDIYDEPYPIKVTFVAGYGDAAAVPDAIKLAVLMYANWLYDNRGDCDCSNVDANCVASGAKSILSRYRVLRTFG